MEAKGLSVAKGSSKSSTTLFSGSEQRTPFISICFHCNEEGHRKSECPEAASSSRGKNGGNKFSRPNCYRKFHCAFCQNDDSFCQTWRCMELKKIDFKSRKALLDSNGDCKICAGDCPRSGCTRPTRKSVVKESKGEVVANNM